VHRGSVDFVFSKEHGSPLHPDVLRKDVLYSVLDKLGSARSTGTSGFLSFRHSAASILNERTRNLNLAQKQLGHSNIDMTVEAYAHTSAEAEREAVLAMERAIYGDLFPVVPNSGNTNNSAAIN
jgi:integrase